MNLALFDFDGTITSNNTWTPFLKFAARPSRMAIGRLLLLPIIVGHRLGAVPAGRAREIANCVAFRGERPSALQQRGAEYATEVIPRILRQPALDRIEWHKSEGDDVVVVSASLSVYVGPWCEARNLLYICTTLEERAGRLTGKCIGGDCSGAKKVQEDQGAPRSQSLQPCLCIRRHPRRSGDARTCAQEVLPLEGSVKLG